MLGANLLANLRRVAAATTALDAEVGALVAKITQKKLLDNTLIIFTSPTRIAVRAARIVGARAMPPTRSICTRKWSPRRWCGAGRDMWCRWPRGRKWSAPTTWFPPSAISPPPNCRERNLCGRSYLALATGKPLPKKQPWRTTVFAQYGDTAMARSDRYKLVVRNEGKGPGELYDDRVDPRERVNQYDNPQFMTVKTALSGGVGQVETEVFGVGGPADEVGARLPGSPPSRLTWLRYFLGM